MPSVVARLYGLLTMALAVGPATGAPSAVKTVLASTPRRVAVTVYRDPSRQRGRSIDLRYLGGFALVTETRTVRLPAGEAVVRFEGVAGGIIPASAVITGLPGGAIEKNRDARLLSPASLIDGSLGRHVTLRRTIRATGLVREEHAVLVSGPAGGVVVRTATGVEALRCSGLPETPVYRRVPPGLSAEPTLSVTTHSPRATTATVTLSYLTSEFDWSASYVATVSADGRTLDLFAWMTLANGNAETFANADVQAVAGRLERREVRAFRAAVRALRLACYPLGTTTSDLKTIERPEADDIIVTAAMRGSPMVMVAPPAPPAPPPPPPPPEDLGDLKLYRVLQPVTVAANQQKQVALLARSAVPFDRRYRITVWPGQAIAARPVRIELRMHNARQAGLGVPLPAGSTSLYARRGTETLLVGLGTTNDTAEGERFSLSAGASPQVSLAQVVDRPHHAVLTLTNANPFAVTVEVRIGSAGQKAFASTSAPVSRIDGVQSWTPRLAANASATLEYSY